MKTKTALALYILLLLSSIQCKQKEAEVSTPLKTGAANLAYQWGKISLELTANDTERFRPRPTVTSRILGLVWTAIYDAWSRYDSTAKPVYLHHVERRPISEFTE